MKKTVSLILAAVFVFTSLSVAVFAQGNEMGYVVVTDSIDVNSGVDVSEEIQKIIDENPNRTIYFPDG